MFMLEEIQKIYNDVSEWLKFLEAKHAGLFAVWTAMFIAIITIDDFWNIDIFIRTAVIIIILIGITINLLSFVPFLNRVLFLKKKCYEKYKKNKNNMIFYQSIFVSTYSEENKIQDSIEKYKQILSESFPQEPDGKIINDYIKQIIQVSEVAAIKAYLFNIATTYTFIIIIGGIVMLIIA